MESVRTFLDHLFFLAQQDHAWEKNKNRDASLGGVVFGNTSGDLDSLVSALALAFLLSHLGEERQYFYPILNLTRQQLNFREDLKRFLHEVLNVHDGIPIERYFFCCDDSFVSKILQKKELHFKNLEISLVDHHTTENSTHYPSWVASSVVHVIDHHSEDTMSLEAIRSQLASWEGEPLHCLAPTCVGSCTSLITLLFFTSKAGKRYLSGKVADLSLCKALAITILNDTKGFDPSIKLKRWGPLDEEAFYYLTQQGSLETLSMKTLWPTVVMLRSLAEQIVSQLKLPQLLYYDSKVFVYCLAYRIHYASFPVSLFQLFSRLQRDEGDLFSSLEECCLKNSLQCIVFLGGGYSKEHFGIQKKQLALYFPKSTPLSFSKWMVDHLMTSDKFQLELHEKLKEFEVPHTTRFFLFHQNNTVSSRKALELFLRHLFETTPPERNGP